MKIKGIAKVTGQRKNGGEFYLKSEFLRPKTLRMKFQKKELKSFEKYLKTGIYGIALKLKMVKDEIK